jgi:hypothetical protein
MQGLWCVKILQIPESLAVILGGLVASLLAIGHKVSGFKPCRGGWILNGDKNPKKQPPSARKENLQSHVARLRHAEVP